jgi:hypothetical protein
MPAEFTMKETYVSTRIDGCGRKDPVSTNAIERATNSEPGMSSQLKVNVFRPERNWAPSMSLGAQLR